MASFIPAEEDDDYDSEGFLEFEEDLQRQKDPRLVASTDNWRSGFSPDHNSIGDGKRLNSKLSALARSAAGSNDKTGQTSVRFSLDGSPATMRSLGSNVLSVDDLKMAVVKGNAELVEKCLNQGVKIDDRTRSGWTALMYAANGACPDIVKLLLRNGANPKCHTDMYTPLMAACSAGSENEENVEECIKILLEAGADVNAKDRFHTTPLMLASRGGHVQAVRQLIKHGAEVNKQDSRGWTALTWAAQRSLKAVVLELLENGADSNIQHSDKLTVKDLAAHLPSDEMLALLERRPANLVSGSGDSQFTARDSQSSSLQWAGDGLAKFTDLRYGELEVFLLGLDLPHLVELFQQQLIDLNLLMTLTEQDLINAGVEQVGARKKILDAVQAVHKKDWQPSSLVSIHYNRKISCADAVAMLANSSKHLRYIGSTIVYVREQLRKHPESITLPIDTVTPAQFMRHTEDTMKNVTALGEQLGSLQSELVKEMKKRNLDPPDLVDSHSSKTRRKYQILGFFVTAIVLSSCTVAVWYRKNIFTHLNPSKILGYFSGTS